MIALLAQTPPTADPTTWLDLTIGLGIPIVVAAIPVAIGVLLHYRLRRAERRDQLRQLFGEALQAISDYQELPYLIRRRGDTPMTREELTKHASGVQSRIDFYVARLELESLDLGEAYGRLATATRRESGDYMTEAWNQERITSDAEVPLGAAYSREASSEERRRCLSVMQTYLGNPMT